MSKLLLYCGNCSKDTVGNIDIGLDGVDGVSCSDCNGSYENLSREQLEFQVNDYLASLSDPDFDPDQYILEK